MKWTSIRPTRDGHYWCRCTGQISGRVYSAVVHVYGNASIVFWDGENFGITSGCFTLWSDSPIPEPEFL